MNAHQLLIGAAGVAITSLVQAQTPLRVTTFPGGANLPLWIAEANGMFALERLKVTVSLAPNSVAMFQSLATDAQDIALAAFDNVVAYQEGQGETRREIKPDFFAFMGVTRGTLRLVVNPTVKNYDDLRGKTLAVDAVATGYSLVLRKMLQLGGLKSGDYRLQSCGATGVRAQSLMRDEFAGTMLTTPLEIAPELRGYRRLANAVDVIGPYQTIVGIARRGWSQINRPALIGFIRAMSNSVDWLLDPKNRAGALAIYRSHLPDIAEPTAQQQLAALTEGPDGFERGGLFDRQGLATVLRIRSEFGLPHKTLTDVALYIDESFQKAAAGP